MQIRNMKLYNELLERLHDRDAVNRTYEEIERTWPQINYRTRVDYVMTPYYRLHIAKLQPPTYMIWKRRRGVKSWFWRLWYEITVRIGREDHILKRRGWEPQLGIAGDYYDILEFQTFHMQAPDFWSVQLPPKYVKLAYDGTNDILYIVRG